MRLIDVIVDMLSDELYKEFKEKQPQSIVEVMKIADVLSTKIYDEIDCTIEDTVRDYCDNKGLR